MAVPAAIAMATGGAYKLPYKESLSVEKKVAIGLYRLAGEIIPYRIIGETFGVAGPTACKVFKQFIFAVIEVGRQCMGCCA